MFVACWRTEHLMQSWICYIYYTMFDKSWIEYGWMTLIFEAKLNKIIFDVLNDKTMDSKLNLTTFITQSLIFLNWIRYGWMTLVLVEKWSYLNWRIRYSVSLLLWFSGLKQFTLNLRFFTPLTKLLTKCLLAYFTDKSYSNICLKYPH